MNWHFEWDDEKATDNLRNHGISFDEAQEGFSDPYGLDEFDAAHSENEPRYNLIALSSRRLLMIVYKEESDRTIRLISARKADKGEQEQYEKR